MADPGLNVRFGASHASTVEWQSDSVVEAVSPAGVGVVDLSVRLGGVSVAAFTVLRRAPTISSVVPSLGGSTSGSTVVTLFGLDFGAAQHGKPVVFVGTSRCVVEQHVSDSQVTASVPAGVGEAEVSIAVAGIVSSTRASFRYAAPLRDT